MRAPYRKKGGWETGPAQQFGHSGAVKPRLHLQIGCKNRASDAI